METFQKLEGNARTCANLNDLFSQWEKAQQVEPAWQKTFPKQGGIVPGETFTRSFCRDGSLGDWDHHKILFVWREPNVTDAEGKITKPNTDGRCWMREVADARTRDQKYTAQEASARDKAAQTKYYNCLLGLARQLGGDSLRECAYMNINKRGGYSSTDFSRLAEYARTYETFILKEIELLQCDRIVVCGRLDDKGVILEILKKADKPVFLYPCHPCRYSKKLVEDGSWKSIDLRRRYP